MGKQNNMEKWGTLKSNIALVGSGIHGSESLLLKQLNKSQFEFSDSFTP